MHQIFYGNTFCNTFPKRRSFTALAEHQTHSFSFIMFPIFSVCKKRDASELEPPVSGSQAKKPRLVFTDLQRRTLQAIFKVCILVGQQTFLEWNNFQRFKNEA